MSSAFQPRRETVDTVNEPGWMLGGDEDRRPARSAVANREIEFRSEIGEATKESQEPRNRAVEQLKVKTRVKYFLEKKPCIYEEN